MASHHFEPLKADDPLVQMGYDNRDVQLKLVWKGVAWFFAFSAISFVVGFGIFAALNPAVLKGETISKPSMAALPPAPNPVLESNVTAKIDIMELRQSERKELEKTAQNADGSYTIPVQKAVDLLAQKGIPEKPSKNVVSGVR